MNEAAIKVAYIGASILFIMALGGLSHQESARKGNVFGMVGMAIAIIATIMGREVTGYAPIIVAMVIGGIIGIIVAARVAMTAMPQLVAILHSFVGLAAVLVGFASYLHRPDSPLAGAEKMVHQAEIYVGVFIGAITFTGSVIAFGKLQGMITSKPLYPPMRHWVNAGLVVISLVLGARFVGAAEISTGLIPLAIMTAIALLLGVHMVMAIGGADMPVVVSMLNSYSGWAAAATGFMLANDLLIITGALVGSSGAILSYIMCRAMNRSFISVISGGFGVAEGTGAARSHEGEEIVKTDVDEVAEWLEDAESVVIVPGYGMAVAQAQYPINEITNQLRSRGIKVRFAIHPVAGRLPGHMNVLLAEAKVPYDIVLEMDEINDDLPSTDVVLIVGANDIVNPDAEEDPTSPIAGMPVLQVWKARTVVVMKRSMATGYAGVQNPLFFKDNTRMLFGDAKASVDGILARLMKAA